MPSVHDREMKILLWALAAAIALTALVQQCKGQVLATFHPQFSERHTTSWEMCATNRGTANASIGMADIYRVTAGRLNVLNASSRAYEMRMRPRNRWLRGLQIAATAATLLQATPALEIGDSWQYMFPLIAGGLQIAGPSIEGNRRQDFELGTYWDGTRTLASGESQCAMVMSLKVKEPRSFAAVMSDDAPNLQGPAVGRLLPRPLAPEAAGPPTPGPPSLLAAIAVSCVVRPSSVEREDGCEAWYER